MKTDFANNTGEPNRMISPGRWTRSLTVCLFLIVVLLLLAMFSVRTGSVEVSAGEIFRILQHPGASGKTADIIIRIRLPRVCMAAILGGALALSGYLLQTFFQNPIAGPYVLGISSGAKMTVALTLVLFLGQHHRVSSLTMVLAAFFGAMLCTGLVLLCSLRIRHMASLLIVGIMTGYICSAVTEFIITFAEDADIVNLHGWSQGSFSGADWNDVRASLVLTGTALFFTFLLAKPIRAFQLGEAYAASLGVRIRWFRFSLILLSSLLSACVTAYAGPVSFVGVAVPFLVQWMLDSSRPHLVIPCCFLGGAVFCVGCDLLARTAFAPTELNLSTVTALFGAPVVILIMLRNRKGGDTG